MLGIWVIEIMYNTYKAKVCLYSSSHQDRGWLKKYGKGGPYIFRII